MNKVKTKTNIPVPKATVDIRDFAVLCLGGFLMSIAYGVTFLIPLLVEMSGGDEAQAGLIISAATLSTVLLVILSGHISDLIGPSRAVAIASIFLALSGMGFAFVPSVGAGIMLVGLTLGVGWGTFYSLGPILVASIIEPARRIRFFALLSGSMMAGIGVGPIIGRLITLWSLSIEIAFVVAAITSLMGGMIFLWLHYRLANAGKVTPHLSKISMVATAQVFRSNAMYSIIMVTIGGAIFGGLSSFQTSYAQIYGFDYSLFFIGFMIAAILCRLLLAGYVLKRDPIKCLMVLTSITLVSIVMFITLTHSPVLYFFSACLLGVGYGLTYSVINGLAANEAPTDYMPQALLLFSLGYFIGVFGFPLVAGNLIVASGVDSMLLVVLVLALSSCAIVLFRLVSRFALPRINEPDGTDLDGI